MDIADAIDRYLNSSAGLKLRDKAAKKAIKSGKGKRGVPDATFVDLCDKLKDYIVNEAAGYDLAPSVMENINSLHVVAVEDDGKNYIAYFNFDDSNNDLSRESLMPGWFPSGVYNIIALFNNGYVAGGTVYGNWSPSRTGKTKTVHITNTVGRNAYDFIGKAIADFNSIEGAKHNATAVASHIYDP